LLGPGGRLALACRAQCEVGSLDPHSQGATEADIQTITTILTNTGFEAIERRDHELGRETLLTLLARRATETPHDQ
jgi:hypothetical protein